MTDDVIYRQAAIDAAIEAADGWDGGYDVQRAHMIEDAIKTLPSAQPPHSGRRVYMAGYADGFEAARKENA